MGRNLARVEDNTPRAEEQKKQRWRTPKLITEKISSITGGDYVPQGNDGGDSMHAQGYQTLS